MLTARIRRTLVERRLVSRGDRILIACSGGPDSVALAHALDRLAGELGLELAIATVDHGLRSESAAEVEAVRKLAVRLSRPFVAQKLRLQDGADLQARARKARYDALRRRAGELGAAGIAVGHTRDDQAETVLSRLLRGASLRGLSGIAPRRDDGVIRPLIDCLRADVRSYLAEHQLEFAADPSNRDRRFQRVRLREVLLPALAAEDGNVVDHLARLADDARDVQDALRRQAEPLLEVGLPVETARSAPRALRRELLGQWVAARCGARPSRNQLTAIEALLESVPDGTAEVWLRDGWTARRSGPTLMLCRDPEAGGRSRGNPHNH